MAGAGFKTFNTGDVLTASDVNTYLMQQTVMVFADSSARTTALGANVAEGMLSYLKDTNAVEVYNGSAWVSSDDPNAIQNTIVDAKGDLISATAADTPSRIAVGTDGQVLTADSSTATGLKWANAASGTTLVGCAAYITGATLSVPSSTATALTLTSEEWDTNGFHSTTTNTSRFTIPSGYGGKYAIWVQYFYASAAGTRQQTRLWVNGAAYTSNGNNGIIGDTATNEFITSVSATVTLAAGDYMEIYVWQNNASSRNISDARVVINYLGA